MSAVTHRSYEFTHALTREPGKSVVYGLRAEHGADPDHESFLRTHQTYINALRQTGAEVLVEPALENFPDSVFIEDTALCIAGKAILLRPGVPSRLGEVQHTRALLTELLSIDNVMCLPEGGCVDGGDVLVTDSEVIVGISKRTDNQGAESLREIVRALGFAFRRLQTPENLLHLKTGCGLLDEETIFAIEPIAQLLLGYKTIVCPEDEWGAANVVRFNDIVLCSSGYPKTRKVLESAGFEVVTINTTELAKIDGGLSCLSLRISL